MRIDLHWKPVSIVLLVSALLAGCGSKGSDKEVSGDSVAESTPGPAAPIARIENAVDTHWGVEVDDPVSGAEEQLQFVENVLHVTTPGAAGRARPRRRRRRRSAGERRAGSA